MELRASEVATVTGGELAGPDVTVVGGTIDSRVLQPGHLFIPIVGERRDGHDFIARALAAGAPAYLTARDAGPGTAVVVEDTRAALAALGASCRDRMGGPVIGITGSVGKTSVKDLTAAALRPGRRTTASPRSFNNELGVPLTLLNAPDDVEVAVLEMGARGRGHIDDLCAIVRPTMGIVTAVELAHTETFGSVEEVFVAKRELVEALPADGTAVLNADDPRVMEMAAHTTARVVTYGVHDGDVRATSVRLDEELHPHFELESPAGTVSVNLAVAGAHNAANAAGAVAAALACGVDLAAAAEGLAHARLSRWRMDVSRLDSGAVLINDAYNANPASMRSGLEALAQVPARRRVALLSKMAELGSHHDAEHRAVAEFADGLGIEVIAIAEEAYGTEVVAGIDEAVERVGTLGPGDAVLVKGSRETYLERLAERLSGGPSPPAEQPPPRR